MCESCECVLSMNHVGDLSMKYKDVKCNELSFQKCPNVGPPH